ncbi:MAG: major facilitator superfamily 1 [Bacteroidetes bacterium]|nr:major facilitator superfamily 1 [Bacteroidota bacterium]
MADKRIKTQSEGRSQSGKRSRRERTFAAFRYPNYRLWFQGQIVSLFGTWMQTTAQGFLIFELTHSPAYLGYVGFASGVPAWLLTLYGGVLADRVSRRMLLIVTQTAMMVFAFVLAGLTFLHIVQPWHVLVLSFLLGVANAFVSAQMALAGIRSLIPADEVILATKEVGDLMSPRLKESGQGGLANTKTGREIQKKVFKPVQ